MALFSIHPSLPFLETALKALISGTLLPELNSPTGLSKVTIFIPSHQAAQTFAHLLSTRHYPCPTIISLGQLPESFESLDLPQALSPQRLHLLVTKCLQKRIAETGKQASLATAYSLAHTLLQFLDTLTLNHISSQQICAARDAGVEDTSGLLPLMLEILLNDIPKILETQGAVTSLQRAKIQMERYGKRLQRHGSSHPVVILGSTGSQLSTRILMKHVASLPNGIVILPGVEHESADSTWLAYGAHPTHPQMLLSRFVESCGQTRKDITPFHSLPLRDSGAARASLLAQALTIPEETAAWAEEAPHRRLTYTTALEGLAIGVAKNERHEATLIATALHEARLKGAQRPTLITPDRTLADYTFQELHRWSEPVVMTAPSSLARNMSGRLALLSLGLMTPQLSPTRVSALLAHPWVTLGLDASTYRTCRPLWDRLFLRHLSPKESMDLFLARIQEFQDPSPHRHVFPSLPRGSHETYSALSPALKEALIQGINTLVTAYSPWVKEQADLGTLKHFIKRHLMLLETLTVTADHEGLHTYPEAKALLDLFAPHMDSDLTLSLEDYRALLELMIKDAQMFPEQMEPADACIQIAGLWEARFLTPDYVVLGGLTETVWPPSTPIDPVFGRALAATLGLPSPEVRVGQSAHDFTQALCRTPKVLITYSRKRNNAPALPSRFLLRLQACLGDSLWAHAHAQGEHLCAVADTLQAPIQNTSLECKGRPSSPFPQGISIPEVVSVRALEQLISDPQAFFTHHVLGLESLSDRTLILSPGIYGSLIHHILGRFAQTYPKHLPSNALEALLSIGAETFATLKTHDHAVDALWWPKFQHVATAFIGWEEKRRPHIEEVSSSVAGRFTLKTAAGPLAITTLTDRVEKRRDGSYALIDFKTGALPSQKEIHTGLALSLLLQGAALEHGSLRNIPRIADYSLTYVHIVSGLKGFEERAICPPKTLESLSAFVALSIKHLERKVGDYYAGAHFSIPV